MRFALDLTVSVFAVAALRAHVATMDGLLGVEADGHLARLVANGVLSHEAPMVVYRRVRAHQPPGVPSVRLDVEVEVLDPPVLERWAREQYATHWGDRSWQPAGMHEIVYEALVGSSEMPAPGIIGIELHCSSDDCARILPRLRGPSERAGGLAHRLHAPRGRTPQSDDA